MGLFPFTNGEFTNVNGQSVDRGCDGLNEPDGVQEPRAAVCAGGEGATMGRHRLPSEEAG